MKLKDRIKTYNFWVSLSSAIFLFLKVLGSQLGFKVDESLFSDLITSLCGILVILGIIVPPSYKNSSNITQENKQENTNLQTVVDDEKQESVAISDIALENVSSTNQNIFESTEESLAQETLDENVSNNCDFETEKLNEPDYFNIEELKLQVSKTLSNQERLLEGHSSLYIELLQTQIDKMLNK